MGERTCSAVSIGSELSLPKHRTSDLMVRADPIVVDFTFTEECVQPRVVDAM